MRVLNLLWLLAVLPQDDVAPKNEWSQFRGSATRTGRSTAEIPDELKLLWSFEAGFSIDSSAAIVNGIVYMTALPGLIAALDLEDGSVVWTRDFGEEDDLFGESSPTVFDGVVYVGDLLGVLHAFDAHDGTTLWTFATEAEIKSSPVVFDDLVLVSSYDEHLYALDRKTGELTWKFQSQGPLHSTPSRHGDLVLVTGCDAVLRGIRLEDGIEQLQMDSGEYTAATPAVIDGVAYYGTFANNVIAVDVNSEQYLWRYEHPTRHFPFYSSAAVAGGKVIVGGRDKMVHAIDQRRGSPYGLSAPARASSRLPWSRARASMSAPQTADSTCSISRRERVWEFEAGAPLVASPALASERVVIGTQDGVLYCFGRV